MNFAFLVSFLASISTLLGAAVLFIEYKDKNKLISKSLSFASGVMIAVSVLDLIPSSVIGLSKNFYIFPSTLLTLSFMAIGVIVSLLINKYLPSDFEKANAERKHQADGDRGTARCPQGRAGSVHHPACQRRGRANSAHHRGF